MESIPETYTTLSKWRSELTDVKYEGNESVLSEWLVFLVDHSCDTWE